MKTRLARIAVFVLVIVVLATTPLVSAQEGPGVTVSLTPYEGNPILTVGEEGAWDSRGVGDPRVIYADGLFHMFYIGWIEGPLGNINAVGYATSEDGLTWTRYEANPVFALDTTTARAGVLNAAVMLDGETWVMLFTPSIDAWTPAETIMRATAPSPTGPWTIDPEPILTLGDTQGGKRHGIAVDSFLRTDESYVLFYQSMYYGTGDGPYYVGTDIGRADSLDGLQWAEYNDPATTERGLTEHDPVLVGNPDRTAWDSNGIGEPAVWWSEAGWEMFYYGSRGGYWSTGFATSEDGITWTRYGDAPLLTAPAQGLGPGSVLVVDDTYYLYYGRYFAATDTMQLEVATVTITHE